jgi:uncharacterized membrane protein
MRLAPSMKRLIAALTAGIVVGGVLTAVVAWQVALLGGWAAASLTLVGSVWFVVARFDGAGTRTHATREDPARAETGLILVSAAVVSLLAVAFALVKANHTQGFDKGVLTALAIATVAASWAVVHTAFTLRYAHEYYSEPEGGIDFKTGDDYEPDYRDFAYVAFTIGMTFQVSDTDLVSRTIRHTALSHALLSYLFGAVILAVTVNAVASLLA